MIECSTLFWYSSNEYNNDLTSIFHTQALLSTHYLVSDICVWEIGMLVKNFWEKYASDSLVGLFDIAFACFGI